MSNIYSFFGLPDPNDDSDSNEAEVVETPIPEPLPIPEAESPLVIDRFHDLGEKKWRLWSAVHRAKPSLAIRYITPDHLHRLPTNGMAHRLVAGDMVVVDLRDLKHMHAQQDACRRELSGMSEMLGAPVFSLDEGETLMLVPGAGSVVDITTHHLGIIDNEM